MEVGPVAHRPRMPNFRKILASPIDLLRELRRKDPVKLHGWPIKLVTKFLPVFLLLILFITIGNQIATPGPSIHCRYFNTTETFQPRFQTPLKNSEIPPPEPRVLNEICQLHDISLLKETDNRNPDFDQDQNGNTPTTPNKGVIKLGFYNYIDILLIGLFVLSIVTSYYNRVRSIRAIVNILKPPPIIGQNSRVRMRTVVTNYMDAAGGHKRFIIQYTLVKIIALATVCSQWFFCYMFFGSTFAHYGINYLLFIFNRKRHYQNPMRSLFPIISWCHKAFYDEDGDFDYAVAVKCRLPLNALNQWTFLIFWCVIVFMIFANLISCLFYAIYLIPHIRTFRYKMFISSVCPNMVDIARTYEVVDNEGKKIRKQASRFSVVDVRLDFADFVVLEVIRKNMERVDKEKEFLVELATTKNHMISIKIFQPQVLPVVTHHVGQPVQIELNEFGSTLFLLDHSEAISTLPSA